MAIRHTYRRRLSYNTKSNKVTIIKGLKGATRYVYLKKTGSVTKCGDCHNLLHGLKSLRPCDKKKASRASLTITRCYGASLCHKCVKTRIMRAFLIDASQQINKEHK